MVFWGALFVYGILFFSNGVDEFFFALPIVEEMVYLQRESMYSSSGGLSSLRNFEALSGSGWSFEMGRAGVLYVVGEVFR